MGSFPGLSVGPGAAVPPCEGVRYRLVAFIDLALLALCTAAGVAAQRAYAVSASVPLDHPLLQLVLFTAMTFLCMFALGLYEPRTRDSFAEVAKRVAAALVLSTMAMGLLWYLLPLRPLASGEAACALALAFAATLGNRSALSPVIADRGDPHRILIMGSGEVAGTLRTKMRRASDWRGLDLVGFVPIAGRPTAPGLAPLLEPERDLPELARDLRVHEIIVATDAPVGAAVERALARCRAQGLRVTEVAAFFERETGKLLPQRLSPDFFARHPAFRVDRADSQVKRGFDIVVSLALLAVSWPLMFLAMLAICLEDGVRAPLLYRQQRVGQGGRVFEVIKLRSMSADAERDGRARWAQAQDPRVTRVGAVLRRTRVDELPQLINVLAGDMALVGPRPERPEFVRELSGQIPYFALRHCVKPGITGWAQTHYPYGASVRDAANKLEFDLYYVKNRSLLLDALVVLRTAEVVLLARGVR